MYTWHEESHFSSRNHWLRAMVLGANDGLISTASLLMGMSAASVSSTTLLLTGIAAMVAGMVSMAAGEYVSVASQADTESADRVKEQLELIRNPEKELEELQTIYMMRGLDLELAKQVAIALTQHDALGSHMRDEVGLSEISEARPLKAAFVSGLAFFSGALLPVLVSVLTPIAWLKYTLTATTMMGLILLGYLSAYWGGAPNKKAILRIILGGGVALLTTNFAGQLLGRALE